MQYISSNPSLLVTSSKVIFSYLIFISTNHLHFYGISLSKVIFVSSHFTNEGFLIAILSYLTYILILLIFELDNSLKI